MTHFIPTIALALLGSLQLSSADVLIKKALARDKKALLIVDVQDCFLPAEDIIGRKAGSLGVSNADDIISNIIKLIKSKLFDSVVFSKDYHPDKHISFASTHGLDPFSHLSKKGGLPLTCIQPESEKMEEAACCPTAYIKGAENMDCDENLCTKEGFSYDPANSIVTNNTACVTCKEDPSACFLSKQAMWTDHCRIDGDSAIEGSLLSAIEVSEIDLIVVEKGGNLFVDAYSAFADNTKHVKTELDMKLVELEIKELYVVGIATDICVKETVLDGLKKPLTAGYTITVVTDATQAVGAKPGDDKEQLKGKTAALQDMAKAGATLKTTVEVLGSVSSLVAADCKVAVEVDDQGNTGVEVSY